KHTKFLIIGSGPAGYTAAIYGARANLSPVLVSGPEPGGQLTVTTDVENYPGFAETIQGPWLMEQMTKQATHVGTELITDTIIEVDFSKRPFKAIGESGTTYTADTLTIATGAQAKWLGLPSEEKFRGYGVSGCATCDGFFFRDQTVAVIGGGNTAVEEALFLTNFAKEVILIHRRDELRSEKILQDRLLKHPKIRPLWHHTVEEFCGEEGPNRLTSLKVKNVQTKKVTDLTVDGAFVAIGHKPATAVFKGHVDMDEQGYIRTLPGTPRTDIPGLFAAGDVHDHVYRQAVTAAGFGCMAALEAEKFLAEHNA
ncbi:MAG: thioredoxin-disulfide reductase, partial [bacterium]|nr:thioredoxin-disulfide reductase [bacterium]